jgi:hypothetical protein
MHGVLAVKDDVGRKVVVASTVCSAMLQNCIDNVARRGMSFVVSKANGTGLLGGWMV